MNSYLSVMLLERDLGRPGCFDICYTLSCFVELQYQIANRPIEPYTKLVLAYISESDRASTQTPDFQCAKESVLRLSKHSFSFGRLKKSQIFVDSVFF